MWIVLLVLILIVLAVAFGGFQKGTKTGNPGTTSTPTSISGMVRLEAGVDGFGFQG
jgi:hypothetical protein